MRRSILCLLAALTLPLLAQPQEQVPVFDQRSDQTSSPLNAWWSIASPENAPIIQQFIPSLKSLDFVELRIGSGRGFEGIFELTIREEGVVGPPLGAAVLKGSPRSLTPVARFSFVPRVALVPGTLYALELRALEGSGFDWMVGAYGGDSYSEGSMFVANQPVEADWWFREGILAPAPVTIQVQPFSRTIHEGGSACFFVNASGARPLSYQWQFNGAQLPLHTNASLCLRGLQSEHSGQYSVLVSNSINVVTSEVATLTVLLGPQPSNSHPALVGSWPWTIEDFGYINVVAARGRYAYGLARGGWFLIFDAKDPTLIHPVGAVQLEGAPRHIALAGSHALIAAGPAGLHIIDISKPGYPRAIGRWPDGNATSATVKGKLALVTDYSQGLSLIDISDPTRPRRVGWYPTGGSSSVSVSGNRAYVAAGGLTILNIGDPAAPRLVRVYTLNSGVKSVIVADQKAYRATERGFRILDVSNPRQPRKLGGFDSGRGAADTMALQGRYVFITDDDGIMQVVDVSDPLRPVRVGVYTNFHAEAYDLAVSGTHGYFTDTDGLHVLDLRKLGVAPRPRILPRQHWIDQFPTLRLWGW